MPNIFCIDKNEYLAKRTMGFYNRDYIGYKQPNNPDFLNILKNTGNRELENTLRIAKEQVKNILVKDIPDIVYDKKSYSQNIQSFTCLNVPRAKALDTYLPSQLMFKETIRDVVKLLSRKIDIIDGTDCIVRIKNTRTTHLNRAKEENIWRMTPKGRVRGNDGELPYPGITKETCEIDANKVKGQYVLLIDDIYTKNVNIDEDCIQALYDTGAKFVVFYAIAHTRGK